MIGEGWLRHYCEGALAYLRGDYESVIVCYHKRGDNSAAKLRCCPMAIAAAIGTGDYPLFLEIESWCKSLIKAAMGADVTVLTELNP